MVTEQELETLLKEHRWTLQSSTMAGGKKAYSAKQRQQGRLVTRYVGTENRLKEMSPEDVLRKVNR